MLKKNKYALKICATLIQYFFFSFKHLDKWLKSIQDTLDNYGASVPAETNSIIK